MSARDDRFHNLVSGLADRVRDQLTGELDDLAERIRQQSDAEAEQAAREAEKAAHSAKAEAEAAAAALLSSAIAAERAGLDEKVSKALADERAAMGHKVASAVAAERAAADERQSAAVAAERATLETSVAAQVETARKAMVSEKESDRQAGLASAERLLAAVRGLDGAGSLSEALDLLTRACQRESGRAAVLMVRGDVLKGWSHAGFPAGTVEPRLLQLQLDGAGLIGEAVKTAAPRSTADRHGASQATLPAPFTLSSDKRVGLTVPVIVDEQVVAVVHADDDVHEERIVPAAWPEYIEVLARHTGRCLEALTARQAAKVRAAAKDAAPKADAAREGEGAQRIAR